MNKEINLEDNNSQLSDIVNQSSWESLNKLKKLSSKKFKRESSNNKALSTSMPDIFQNKLDNRKLSMHTRSPSQTDDMNHKSANSISGGFGSSNNSTHNTNYEIEYLNINFNNLSADEINSQLDVIKKLYEKKISEIDRIYKEINIKDEKINQITQQISNLLKKEEENQTKNNSTNNQLKQISELKIEINNLKRKHNKKLAEIEKENEEEISNNLEKIREEYNMRIREFSEGHDKNIKLLQEEIFSMKSKLEKFENKELYITKSHHNEILEELKKVKIFF